MKLNAIRFEQVIVICSESIRLTKDSSESRDIMEGRERDNSRERDKNDSMLLKVMIYIVNREMKRKEDKKWTSRKLMDIHFGGGGSESRYNTMKQKLSKLDLQNWYANQSFEKKSWIQKLMWMDMKQNQSFSKGKRNYL